jgi:hypothetical protein
MNHDERNLLNASFKNPLNLKRRQWRSLLESHRGLPPEVRNSYTDLYKKKKGSMESVLIRFEKDTVEGEIIGLIKADALPLLERLLKISTEHEPRALYLKLKGDLKRYLAEMMHHSAKEREDIVEEARLTYE